MRRAATIRSATPSTRSRGSTTSSIACARTGSSRPRSRRGRSPRLAICRAWDKGWVPASALGWGARRLAPRAFKPIDVNAVTVTEEAVGGEARFALDQEPQVEGALVAIDPYTGQVKAMVGGYDFRRSQFNRAVQAKRQPGSAFKPLIYSCAIDNGFTPASIVLDAPITLPDGNRPP